MTISVGLLYSGQTLLEIVEDGGMALEQFHASFAMIDAADASFVLEAAQKCHWLRLAEDGVLRLTERGTFLRSLSKPTEYLREQLHDLLLADPPPWSRKMIQGRQEAIHAMPDEALQCFKDCALIESTEDDVVDWWDRTSGGVRSARSRLGHEIGRRAEKLSLAYERVRTGAEPVWQAIETNVSGFDVLSVVDSSDQAKLKIEVKGSGMRKSEAPFFVTRNEWNTARRSVAYDFHLWLLQEQPKLFVVPAADIAAHIPANQGSGSWETAQLFFRDFGQFEVPT